jgi:hypothetical protein
MQELAGEADTELEGQAAHAEAPVAAEYVPAVQSLQKEATHALIYGQNLPAAQSVQTEAPLSENLPAAHQMHAVSAVAPVLVRYLPAPQFVHAAGPVVGLYHPALHASQSAPSNPALQAHVALPAGAAELAWQVRQVVA